MSDFDVAPPDEFVRTPIYRELCAPLGLRWVAGVKVAAGDDLWCLAIQRSAAEGPFGPEDIRRLSALSRNLSAAAATARAFGFARAEGALDAFEMSASAVVLFDRSGDVFRLNKAAERLLGDDVQIVGNRLVSRIQSATAALDRALHAVLWRSDGGSLRAPVSLPREEGHPVLAYVSRLSGVTADSFAPCQVVAVLVALEARVRPAERDLISVFNLTPAGSAPGEPTVERRLDRRNCSRPGNNLRDVTQAFEEHFSKDRHPSASAIGRAARSVLLRSRNFVGLEAGRFGRFSLVPMAATLRMASASTDRVRADTVARRLGRQSPRPYH